MEDLKEWFREHGKWVMLIGGGVLVIVVGVMLFGHSNNSAQPAMAENSSAVNGQSSGVSHSEATTMTSGSSHASSTPASTSSITNSNSANQPAFADVQGAVVKPGLYPISATTRVADLIVQAGGLTAKADRLQINLAQKVNDQQVILVPEKGSTVRTATTGTNGMTSSSGTTANATNSSPDSGGATKPGNGDQKINLNSADITQLQQLSGIGAKKAQKIIDYRNSHGPFKSVGDLQNVAGFGAKTIAKYQDQLTV